VTLTPDELLSQFRGLLDGYRAARDPVRTGEGNLRCEGCLDCNRCRFCVGCVRCDDCSNCEQCEDCVRCTRTKNSRGCTSSNYVELSDGCEDSQYLTLCLACTRCEQCFACVGLQGESYCILNRRYSRKEYFVIVQGLKKRLEEQGSTLLAELAAASRGRWTATSPRGSFAAVGGVVRAVVDGPEPITVVAAAVEVEEEEDPWLEGIVPARVDGVPTPIETGPRVSVVPPG
jgi:hypothetical protein